MAESIPAAAVSAMHPRLAESYPTKHQMFEPFDDSSGEDGSVASTKFVGYDFVADGAKHYVAARTDGFTFSRLQPYDNWETFTAEAKRVWEIYRSVNVSSIASIGVRYINRIEIPIPVNDLRQYLRTLPELAPELPHTIKSFLMRLEIPKDDDTNIVIMQGTVKTGKPNVVALMLDIEISASAEDCSDDEIWSRFEALRVMKNETFEYCITDGVRDIIR